MTFADICDRVAKRLNLTSPEAMIRISEGVNDRYRRLRSDLGMQTSVRDTVTQAATIGNRLLTFEDVTKLYVVFDDNVTPSVELFEISAEEMRNRISSVQPSREYAIWQSGATSVTIKLDATPTSAYVYSADADVVLPDLTGMDEPNFPQSHHDILVTAGIAEECFKLEKYDKADRFEKKYDDRLGELRLHLATSTTRTMYQGQVQHRWMWR